MILLILILMGLQENMKAQHTEIKLWNSEVPNAIDAVGYKESHDIKLDRVSQVSEPTLTVFKPEEPNGTSVIICPGGGYGFLAINKEGHQVAKWLNTFGITAFVLKYRLPSDEIMQDKSVGPLQDAQEALRYVRRNAKKWNLNSDKIGIMGFSAGGHLAATLSTKYDEVVYPSQDDTSAKPDFALLIYPVISMTDGITHMGSRERLLGKNPSEELIQKFSTETLITSETSVTFLVHAEDDKGVLAENSINYYLSLRKHKVVAEMHLYQSGGHGFGLGKEGTSQFWTKDCENWLRQNHLIH